MTKKEHAEFWASNIRQGLSWRSRLGREPQWNDIKRYYENRFGKDKDPGFNLIYMLCSALIPSLVFNSPSIINTACRPAFNYWAQFFDGIDNWLVDEMELQDAAEEAVLYAFLYNTVGLQVGFDYGEDSEGEEELQFKHIPGVVDRSRKTNMPWVDVIPPQYLILAPGTRKMRNCPWFAKYLCVPTATLKKLKSFNGVKVTAEAEQVSKDENSKWRFDQKNPAVEYTAFYEVHEAEMGTTFCIDTDWNVISSVEKDPLQLDGLPLEVLSFNRNTEGLWGTPDALYIETQHLEGYEIRRDSRLQRRLAIVKAFYDSNILSEADVQKFLSGDPMTMIPVRLPAGKNLGDCLAMVQPHVQMELYQSAKEVLNDAQLLTGNGPNQFGTFAPGRRSKYETQVVEERNLLRTGDRRGRLGDRLAAIIGKSNQLICEYWKAPTVSRVLGVDAALYWVQAKPKEFSEVASNLVTKVNIESMTPVSRERRKSEFIEVLGALSKFQGINPFPIIRKFLSQFDWADVSEVLPQGNAGQPMPMDQFQQQQQGLLQNTALPGMVQSNLGGMNGLISAMPNGGNTNEG